MRRIVKGTIFYDFSSVYRNIVCVLIFFYSFIDAFVDVRMI